MPGDYFSDASVTIYVCRGPIGWIPAATVQTTVGVGGFFSIDGLGRTGHCFPGFAVCMVLVVASIGSEGLLGTEALQSCLPHQLDLRTGQLWADGQSTLQQVVRASAHIKGSLVMPPDIEIVAPVSIHFPLGIPPGRCSLIEPELDITESYGVLVGRILVDTSDWFVNVLLINQGSIWWCCSRSCVLVI